MFARSVAPLNWCWTITTVGPFTTFWRTTSALLNASGARACSLWARLQSQRTQSEHPLPTPVRGWKNWPLMSATGGKRTMRADSVSRQGPNREWLEWLKALRADVPKCQRSRRTALPCRTGAASILDQEVCQLALGSIAHDRGEGTVFVPSSCDSDRPVIESCFEFGGKPLSLNDLMPKPLFGAGLELAIERHAALVILRPSDSSEDHDAIDRKEQLFI